MPSKAAILAVLFWAHPLADAPIIFSERPAIDLSFL